MATGKTHSKHVTVTYGGQDISDGVDSINGIGITYEETDVGGLNDALNEFVQGRGDLNVALSGKFDNTATTGSYTVLEPLNGDTTGSTLTIAIGIGAAPTTGDPEFEATAIGLFGFTVDVGDAAVMYSGNLRPLDGAAAAWGTVSA